MGELHTQKSNNQWHEQTSLPIQTRWKTYDERLHSLLPAKNGKYHLHFPLTKKESVLQFSPIEDSSSFLMALANTHALAWCLFSNSLPLTQDLYELFQIMLVSHHLGELQNTGEFQTHWYAHALWGLYQAIINFLHEVGRIQSLSGSTFDKSSYHLHPRYLEAWNVSTSQGTCGTTHQNKGATGDSIGTSDK